MDNIQFKVLTLFYNKGTLTRTEFTALFHTPEFIGINIKDAHFACDKLNKHDLLTCEYDKSINRDNIYSINGNGRKAYEAEKKIRENKRLAESGDNFMKRHWFIALIISALITGIVTYFSTKCK